jgi:Mrp family chromosome partitioning ATPase
MNIYRDLIDGVIIVVKSDSTKRTDIDRCIQAFGKDKLIGFVLNGVQQELPAYYRNYSHNS